MAATEIPGAMTREMQLLHTAFLREFFLMPELVGGVFVGDTRRAEIAADHIGLILTGLHEHHSGEDRHIWPRLIERCPDELRPLVHGMEAHHERIATLMTTLTGQLSVWRSNAETTARRNVLGTLADLLPVLREHLDEEIEYVLPLIERHIARAEWDAMLIEGFGQMPREALPLVLGMLMYEGEPTAVQDALAQMPPEARPDTNDAPRVFGDHAERTFGIRHPPFWATLSGSAEPRGNNE